MKKKIGPGRQKVLITFVVPHSHTSVVHVVHHRAHPRSKIRLIVTSGVRLHVLLYVSGIRYYGGYVLEIELRSEVSATRSGFRKTSTPPPTDANNALANLITFVILFFFPRARNLFDYVWVWVTYSRYSANNYGASAETKTSPDHVLPCQKVPTTGPS